MTENEREREGENKQNERERERERKGRRDRERVMREWNYFWVGLCFRVSILRWLMAVIAIHPRGGDCDDILS